MTNYKSQLINISQWLVLALTVYLWLQFAFFRSSDDPFVNNNGVKPLTTKTTNSAKNSIANYHIFGSAPELYAVPLSQGQTSLNFTLNGTMSNADINTGLAYISNVQGVQSKFKVGDKVFDLATLVEIHKTYVVLDNKGKKERLSLPEKLTTNNNRKAQNNNAKNKASIVNHLNDNSKPDWNELMQQQQFDPNKISNIVNNSELLIDQSGSVQGIRVSNLASGVIDLAKVGLKPSDIITAVNGTKISSNNLLTVAKTIQDTPNSNVTIKRNGKIHNIQININDLNK
jgi:type II secretion system protein C